MRSWSLKFDFQFGIGLAYDVNVTTFRPKVQRSFNAEPPHPQALNRFRPEEVIDNPFFNQITNRYLLNKLYLFRYRNL